MRGERITSGTEWEDEVGYSRAVRIGDRVIVSGTTATVKQAEDKERTRAPVGEGRVPRFHDSDEREGPSIAGVGDPYEQALQAMRNIVRALTAAGASASDVVRTRMYVTDIESWEDIGRAHEEVFGHAKPVTTMVEVSRLIDERMVVEVEAEAVAPVEEPLPREDGSV